MHTLKIDDQRHGKHSLSERWFTVWYFISSDYSSRFIFGILTQMANVKNKHTSLWGNWNKVPVEQSWILQSFLQLVRVAIMQKLNQVLNYRFDITKPFYSTFVSTHAELILNADSCNTRFCTLQNDKLILIWNEHLHYYLVYNTCIATLSK